MQVPENAEWKDLVIQGVTLKAPLMVSPKDFAKSFSVTSPDMAANMFNQLVFENLRNNFSKVVQTQVMKIAEDLGSDAKSVKDFDDETAEKVSQAIDTEALQAEFNKYIEAYEPGVRRVGGGEVLSPVDREARKIAVDIIRNHLESKLGIGRNARSESYKTWDAKIQEEKNMTGLEYIQELADDLLEKKPEIRKTAEQNVAARKKTAEGISLDI